MSEAVETKTREERIQELTEERSKLLQVEEALRSEEESLKKRRAEILDSDDQELLERVLSGRPLPAKSEYKRNESRLAEIPSLVYGVVRRRLQATIELAELEQEVLTEQREETGKQAYAAQEALIKAEEERNFTQSIAAGAAADLQEKIRLIGRLRDQLEQHENAKPDRDEFLRKVREHRLWRGG